MKTFNDDGSDDLSEFKIISFEDLNNGFSKDIQDIIVNPNNSPEFRSKFHDFRNTPLGYSYITDDPVSIYPYTGKDKGGNSGYEYEVGVLDCESGSEVYEEYNKNKTPEQSLYFFYEKPNNKKSNFAGPFYIASMGTYFVDLLKRKQLNVTSRIGKAQLKNIQSKEDVVRYIAQLCYTRHSDKINPTIAYQAVVREFQFKTNDRQLEEIIGSISTIPSEAIGWCAGQVRNLKTTEKNYEPSSKDYSPLIPVFITGISAPVNVNKAAEFFENLSENPFIKGADTVFSKAWELIEKAATKIKDAVLDHLPVPLRNMINRISGIITILKNFLFEIQETLSTIADKGVEFLKILNAVNCGLVDSMLGLIECILYILELLLQPAITFSYKNYLERRDLLEKAEDVLDWFHLNIPQFVEGIISLFGASDSPSSSDTDGLFNKIKEMYNNASRYKVVYYAGIVGFEFLINILLLIFTEGAGNIVKGKTYLAKMWSLTKVVAKEGASAVTMGFSDLLLFLGKFVFKFAQTCKKGWKAFFNWIEELLTGAKNGSKADDLVEEVKEIEEVVMKGKKGQIVEEIPGYITKRAKMLSHAEDAVSRIVKNVEKTIMKEKWEYAYIHHEAKGFKSKSRFTSKSKDWVHVFDAFGAGTKRISQQLKNSLKNAIFTHNHPNNSSLSAADIMTFMEYRFKELRAIGKDAVVHSISLKKGATISKKFKKRIFNELEELEEKWRKDLNIDFSTEKGQYLLQNLQEQFLLDKIDHLIEYKIFK